MSEFIDDNFKIAWLGTQVVLSSLDLINKKKSSFNLFNSNSESDYSEAYGTDWIPGKVLWNILAERKYQLNFLNICLKSCFLEYWNVSFAVHVFKNAEERPVFILLYNLFLVLVNLWEACRQ